jgi:hypothetical protein
VKQLTWVLRYKLPNGKVRNSADTEKGMSLSLEDVGGGTLTHS